MESIRSYVNYEKLANNIRTCSKYKISTQLNLILNDLME